MSHYIERFTCVIRKLVFIIYIFIKLICVFGKIPPSPLYASVPELPRLVLVYTNPNHHNNYPHSDADDADVDEGEYAIYDDIDEAEDHAPEKQTGKYYLGGFVRIHDWLLMDSTVSARTFFRYDFPVVCRYIWTASTFENEQSPEFHIMKLYITESGVYEVVLKTTWIRIVQRAWKRRFAERKRAIQMRGSVIGQEYFRTNGRYQMSAVHIPSLRGLLSM